MNRYPKTLLVVVAEAVLERPLLRDARERGVQGWTVSEVHGAWREGERSGDWEAERTVRIELICEEAVAEALAEHVLAAYAPHYSVALHLLPVGVLRPDRY